MADATKVVVIRNQAFDYHAKIEVYVNLEDGAVQCIANPLSAENLAFQKQVFEKILGVIEDLEEMRLEEIADVIKINEAERRCGMRTNKIGEEAEAMSISPHVMGAICPTCLQPTRGPKTNGGQSIFGKK